MKLFTTGETPPHYLLEDYFLEQQRKNKFEESQNFNEKTQYPKLTGTSTFLNNDDTFNPRKRKFAAMQKSKQLLDMNKRKPGNAMKDSEKELSIGNLNKIVLV